MTKLLDEVLKAVQILPPEAQDEIARVVMESTKYPDGKRQAVVIIHGIGEQRPMETLRHFVDAPLPKGDQGKDEAWGIPYYSKPDTISDSYELRRIKLKKLKDPETGESINQDWKYQTDFFEYYWPHHMSGTEWLHVFSWLRRILHRSLCDVTAKVGILCSHVKQDVYRYSSDDTVRGIRGTKQAENDTNGNCSRLAAMLGP